MENEQCEDWLKNVPATAENLAFKPEEMLRCEKCQRTNPPNRLNCLYCGVELEISEAQMQNLQPNLRKLENWEKGFNLIVKPNPQIAERTNFVEIARFLKIEPENFQRIVETEKALPLLRVELEKEVEIAKNYLARFGFESFILSDETLAVEKTPQRLRGIEFFDDKIILVFFNQDEIIEIGGEDLVLIVTGAVFERKVEAIEKRNKKGENKILDTTETASDEFLLDIYSRTNSEGFRIWAKGFDFSGLEAEKGILAKDNLKKLADKLRQISPNAKFVNDYLQIREVLANVWEVEQKNESQGLKRESFGKFNLSNLTIINNSTQFTKYSRFQWHLL